jgi:hypothetical protein
MEVFLANVVLGIGYLLLFAAFYKGGKHALRPWQGLTE